MTTPETTANDNTSKANGSVTLWAAIVMVCAAIAAGVAGYLLHGFLLKTYGTEAFDSACAINETFNCTRGNGRKIIDAAEIIKEKLGLGNIITKPHDTFYPNRDTLNSDKAKTMLNFNPIMDIEEGIPKYINWFLKQPFYFDNLKINPKFVLGTTI